MSENPIDQRNINRKGNIPHRNQLLGKVVLLVSNDTAILHHLVTQLAQKGADIALLCWRMPAEKARQLKESVQAAGSRLCLIEQADHKSAGPGRLLDTIIAAMGHLDIFIDLSAQKPESENTENKLFEDGGSNAIFPHWQFTQAALEEIAHA